MPSASGFPSRLTSVVMLILSTAVLAGQQAAPVSQRPQGTPAVLAPLPSPERDDFPGFDGAAWQLLQRGLTAKTAARRMAEAPEDPETVRLLSETDRPEDALAALRRLVERDPAGIAKVFTGLQLYTFQRDASRNYAQKLTEIAAIARTKLPGLPREARAEAAQALMNVENRLDQTARRNAESRLRSFIQDYAGTEASALAEVTLITMPPLTLARFDLLDEFARQHPGTVAAARAIYQKGWDLAHNASALRIEPPGSDPTARFNRVVEVVRTLQGGAYPKCEWVDKAPELLTGFFMYNVKFSSTENIDAMLRTYRDLVRAQHRLDPKKLTGSTLAYVITSKMHALYELRGGDPIAGVESELELLEKDSPEPTAVRMLRAQFYLGRLGNERVDRAAMLAKAAATLTALEATQVQPVSRQALAALAAIDFFQRDYASARPLYERYLAQYPTSDWAWAASIRLAQTQLALGDTAAAASTYTALSSSPNAMPFARALAHAFAAEVLASTGRVADALRHAEAAWEGWDDDHGLLYRSQAAQDRRPGDEPFGLPSDTNVDKSTLPARIAELREAAQLPGGSALEQGRALIRQSRYADARTVLERVAVTGKGTPLEGAARSLAHRAWLHQALALADVESRTAQPDVALEELTRLSADPLDFHVFAAQVTRATMLAMRLSPDADAIITTAFQSWAARQPKSAAPVPGSLDEDLVAIRAAVFLPLGGGVYGGKHWNAFEFPATMPPFLVSNPTMLVKLSGGGVQRIALRQPMTGFANLLYLDEAEMSMLAAIIKSLGGTSRREPTQVMETPNQPAGSSRDVIAFWNRFFPMRPGHWGGWVFETFPTITEVSFENRERTRAAVRVTVGYSGGTVVLVKEQGTWKAIDLVNLWIT